MLRGCDRLMGWDEGAGKPGAFSVDRVGLGALTAGE